MTIAGTGRSILMRASLPAQRRRATGSRRGHGQEHGGRSAGPRARKGRGVAAQEASRAAGSLLGARESGARRQDSHRGDLGRFEQICPQAVDAVPHRSPRGRRRGSGPGTTRQAARASAQAIESLRASASARLASARSCSVGSCWGTGRVVGTGRDAGTAASGVRVAGRATVRRSPGRHTPNPCLDHGGTRSAVPVPAPVPGRWTDGSLVIVLSR